MSSFTDDVLRGFEDFLVREVDRVHQDNPWLAEPRQVFGPDGRYEERTLDLIRQVRMRSAEAGYYTMALPFEVGGADLGYTGMFLAWELLFRHCGSTHWLGHSALAHWSKGPSPLLRHATPEVREKVVAGLASGEQSMCFAMSEPDAGSDSWMMRTRATKVDGGWTLAGSKQWISNGTHADVAIVIAVTDPGAFAAKRGGVGAFLLDTSTSGFTVSGVSPMFHGVGSDEAILSFDDAFVPDAAVLGEPTQGFAIAMEGVSFGRIYNCAKASGLASWALHLSLEYVKVRQAFGRALSEHEAIGFGLADSAIGIRATRLVALDVARRLDEGQPARKDLAMAKVLATDSALAAIDRAVQSHGAMGFTNEVGLARAWQMIRVLGVADGTSEILRRQVIQQLLRGDTEL